jgi:hypothetical protein
VRPSLSSEGQAFTRAFREQMASMYRFGVRVRSDALEDLRIAEEVEDGIIRFTWRDGQHWCAWKPPRGPALWYSKAEGWVFL